MKLFNYYNIDECRDDGKIEYEMDGLDIFKIEDIDLEESDIEDLNDLFDDEDVFPYLDNEEEEEDDDYYDESSGDDY